MSLGDRVALALDRGGEQLEGERGHSPHFCVPQRREGGDIHQYGRLSQEVLGTGIAG